MKPLTKQNIYEDPWFGGQVERVLALLERIEDLESKLVLSNLALQAAKLLIKEDES